MLPPLFADANIAIAIVRFLRLQGVDQINFTARKMSGNALISIRIPKDMMRLDALRQRLGLVV